MVVDSKTVAVMGSIFLFAALIQYINTIKFVKNSVRGRGIIVGKGRKNDFTNNGVINFISVEFYADGKLFKFFSNVINVNKYSKGMEVGILYSPAEPSHVYINSFGQLYFIEFIMACIGISMIVIFLLK